MLLNRVYPRFVVTTGNLKNSAWSGGKKRGKECALTVGGCIEEGGKFEEGFTRSRKKKLQWRPVNLIQKLE